MIAKLATHFAGALLFLSIFLTASWFIGLGNDEAFDSNAWRSANARDRGRMAQHLVDNQCLVGRSAESVGSTLGTPDHDWGKVHQYRIDLGWPMKNPNTYGLQLHFDADRNVKLVKIVD
jgi:hypothetical protein